MSRQTINLGNNNCFVHWKLQPTLSAWGKGPLEITAYTNGLGPNSLCHTSCDKLGYSPKVSVLFADRLQSVNNCQGIVFVVCTTVYVVLGAAGYGAGGGGDGGRMGSMS